MGGQEDHHDVFRGVEREAGQVGEKRVCPGSGGRRARPHRWQRDSTYSAPHSRNLANATRRRSLGGRRISRHVGQGSDRNLWPPSSEPYAWSSGCNYEKSSNTFCSKRPVRGPLADRLTVNKRGFLG